MLLSKYRVIFEDRFHIIKCRCMHIGSKFSSIEVHMQDQTTFLKFVTVLSVNELVIDTVHKLLLVEIVKHMNV